MCIRDRPESHDRPALGVIHPVYDISDVVEITGYPCQLDLVLVVSQVFKDTARQLRDLVDMGEAVLRIAPVSYTHLEFVNVFTGGAKDLVGVVFVLSASRGISMFMGSSESGMSITFIYWIQKMLAGVPLWAFVMAGFAAYFGIGLFLQSTSGVAGITMPVFGAVAFALFSASAVGPAAVSYTHLYVSILLTWPDKQKRLSNIQRFLSL